MKTENPPDSARQSTTEQAADGSATTAPGVFADAFVRLREISEYVGFYVATKADAIKLAVRSAVLYAVLGVAALIAAAAAVVVAVALILVGLAHAISAALGGMYWLGDLIVGVVVLLFIAIGAVVIINKVTKSSRKLTVEKYESRKREQRFEFGHDVRQRAGESNG